LEGALAAWDEVSGGHGPAWGGREQRVRLGMPRFFIVAVGGNGGVGGGAVGFSGKRGVCRWASVVGCRALVSG